MKHSESITNIAKALLAAQAEMENATKNATNPHFKNRYADLAEILATVKPVLTKHGITVTQFPGYENGVTTVETILAHTSGEYLSGTAGAKVQKDDPQGVGSAITYLRRYSLAAVCGIAQEDDDGNAASSPQSVRREAEHYEAGAAVHARTGQQPRTPNPNSTPVGVKHTNAPDIPSQTLTFGKHQGKTWAWLVEHHPDYVQYCIDKVDRIAPEAKDYLKLMLAERAMDPAIPARVGGGTDTPLSEPDDNLPFAPVPDWV